MERRWIAAAVTGWLMAVVGAAAGAAESREAREREARKACFTGNVDRGVEILVDLYGETGHPNYIFNQARCFERNGKYDQALLSYEDYLRKATNLGESERAQVEKSIAELRAKVGSPSPARPSGAAAAGGPALLTPSLEGDGSTPGAKPDDNALLPLGAADKTGAAALALAAHRGGHFVGRRGRRAGAGRGGNRAAREQGGRLQRGLHRRQRRADARDRRVGRRLPGQTRFGRGHGADDVDRLRRRGRFRGGRRDAGAARASRGPDGRGRAASRCGPMLAAGGGTTGVVCGWSF